MLRPVVALIFSSCLLWSCSNNDYQDNKKVDPETIFLDYQLRGDEESGFVTLKLQYRLGGSMGRGLLLEEPSKVEFDGKVLQPDSSKLNGVYYDISIPIDQLAGKHTIVYTDIKKKTFREEFDFPLVSLATKVPDSLHRRDLEFNLTGVREGERLHLLLTDTSFYSKGIDRVDSVRGGKIIVSKKELDNLRSGPVQLEFYQERERRPMQVSRAGGRLSFYYGLKRVFELRD